MADREATRIAAEEAAKRLGYSTLKELELNVVLSVATGHDVFAVLPTGYGKSLCYGYCSGNSINSDYKIEGISD